jgi:glycosyltransferase involved in cell wall biosynthesis
MRIGIDVQKALDSDFPTGLYFFLQRLTRAVTAAGHRPHPLALPRPGRTYPPDQLAALGRAFGTPPVKLVRRPRRCYRLWLRYGRLGRLDAVWHLMNSLVPHSPATANVYTVPDVIPLAVDYGEPGYTDWCREYYETAVRAGDAIVVWSEHTKQDVRARVGGRPERIHVVPLAAGPEFTPRPAAAVAPVLARYGLTGVPFVLSVGTLETRKDYPTLIRAFARLLAKDPALPNRLVLVGGKWASGEPVLDLIRTSGVADRVSYLGYADGLPELYAAAAAFVFPSRYEGFGLPPLEAMACGAPTLAADATSLPEVVGDAGLLFPPGDDATLATQLERVLTDRPYRDDLARRALARAAGFTWDRTAAGYLAATRAAIRAKGSAPEGAVRA